MKPEAGSSIELPNEGNCYECEYNPEENKHCKKFYEVEIHMCDIE